MASWQLFRVLAGLLLLAWRVPAPIPCSTALREDVEVGGNIRPIGLSTALDHGVSQERDCAYINSGYEGPILLTCHEGSLNVTAEGCFPRRCFPWDAVTVRLGDYSVSSRPLDIIASGEFEWRLCRTLNALYRGKYILYCNEGQLSVDISNCVTQWDPMDEPPWSKRARHAAVGLSDGAVLMLGGLGNQGPIREVWQWNPKELSYEGNWVETPKVPPWSARFGLAAVRQIKSEGEQVTIMGGNDNQNRRDTWRWLRNPAPIQLILDESEPTGTQRDDCEILSSGSLYCYADVGVSGRTWHISHYLEESLEIHLDMTYGAGPGGIEEGSGAAGVGALVIAVQLDDCRHVFRAEGGSWSTTGCTGTDPPWARSDKPSIRLGPEGAAYPGERNNIRLVLDRDNQEIAVYSNDAVMVAAGASPESPGVPVGGGVCGDYSSNSGFRADNDTGVCKAGTKPPVSKMHLRSIEVAVWPEASVEIRSLAVTSPAGYWQPLIDKAPWPARSSHAAVALPDGDILLMGGVGETGLLNDVWRWSPRKCTLLPDMSDLEARRFGLQCLYECYDSPIYGQWQQLSNAPWAARQETAAVWTATGVLVLGGRTAQGFKNDVWKWESYGEFCSLTWKGTWTELTPAAGWEPRHGASIIGFSPHGEDEWAVTTVLMIGGFGGYPYASEVIRAEPQEANDRVNPRNDMWCGYTDLDHFATWVEIAPLAPFSPRAQTAAVIAPSIGTFSLVFFGGYDENSRLVADLWRWSGENNTFQCITDTLD